MSKFNQRQNFTTRLVNETPDKFKALFEAAPVPMVEGIWGQTFKVLSVNSAALDLFSAENSVKFSIGFNDLLIKIPRKIILELLSARVKGDHFEAEFRLPTFKNKLIYVFMRLAYIPDSTTGAQHVVLAFQDISNIKRQENLLKRLSQVDGLTQLLNQRTILQRLDEELSRAKRYQLDLSCIIFDLDNFKLINDNFGHLTGDKQIRRVAQTLKQGLRKTDIVGRYGGDEFLAILPETKPEQATIAVERLIKDYEKVAEVKGKDDRIIKTSFSVGISGYPFAKLETGKDLIKAADTALYISKTSGGNRYQIYA
jgi:diguanylate cyclase (GGDEF)-like protein